MKEKIFIGELTWKEYEDRIKQGDVILIPVGSLEQHGYHMPLCVDAVLPTAVSERIAKLTKAMVAPTIQYGYKSQPKSGGGNHYIGTTSLDGYTLTLIVKDILGEFVRHGVRKIAFINGHFENNAFVVEGIDLALKAAKALGIDDLRIMLLSYWDFASDQEALQVLYPNPNDFPGWNVEHAGVFETSLMLALRPDLVDIEKAVKHQPVKFPDYDMYPVNADWIPEPGTLSLPFGATAEKGEYVLKKCSEAIAKVIEYEFK